MNRFLFAVAASVGLLCFLLPGPASGTTRPSFHYAVVISRQTAGDPRWNEVATALVKKYPDARIFTYGDLGELVDPLNAFSPDSIAFVCRPEEASAGFVERAGNLNRRLENAPYGTAVGAIVTGYGPEDAMRIARNGTPPQIDFGLGGMLGFIDAVPAGVAYSELTDAKQDWQEKKAGQGRTATRWTASGRAATPGRTCGPCTTPTGPRRSWPRTGGSRDSWTGSPGAPSDPPIPRSTWASGTA